MQRLSSTLAGTPLRRTFLAGDGEETARSVMDNTTSATQRLLLDPAFNSHDKDTLKKCLGLLKANLTREISLSGSSKKPRWLSEQSVAQTWVNQLDGEKGGKGHQVVTVSDLQPGSLSQRRAENFSASAPAFLGGDQWP